MPELIFVGAIGDKRHKSRHKHSVFEVITRRADGTPDQCRLLLDTDVVDLEERMKELGRNVEFITAYVPEVNFKRKGGGQ